MYLFNKKIEPSCSYCRYGKYSIDNNKILCNKKGILEIYNSCNKFRYDPLKRSPKRQIILPKFEKSDFQL